MEEEKVITLEVKLVHRVRRYKSQISKRKRLFVKSTLIYWVITSHPGLTSRRPPEDPVYNKGYLSLSLYGVFFVTRNKIQHYKPWPVRRTLTLPFQFSYRLFDGVFDCRDLTSIIVRIVVDRGLTQSTLRFLSQ